MSSARTTDAVPLLSAAERRTRNNGIVRAGIYAVVGLLALWVGLVRVPGSQLTVYKLVFDESVVRVPDLSLPVGLTYAGAGVIALIVAGLQFRSPSGESWRRLMTVTIFALVFAVLTGILGGKSPSLVGLTSAMVSFALPIVFAGLAAILCERSGVMNIGIEGIILLGACATSIGGSLLGIDRDRHRHGRSHAASTAHCRAIGQSHHSTDGRSGRFVYACGTNRRRPDGDRSKDRRGARLGYDLQGRRGIVAFGRAIVFA